MNDPLAPRSPAPLAQPGPRSGARPGIGAGVSAMFSGVGFIVSTPEVWPLALVPVAIGTGLTAVLSAVAIKLVPPLFTGWLGDKHDVLAMVLGVLATALAMLLGGVIAFGLAQPLSGPALERIVRRAQAKEGVVASPPTSFQEDVLRSLGSLLVSSAFGVPLLALLFLVGLVFPPAVVVTFPLKLIVLALLAAWDFCDYPLSIRGVPIRTRIAFVRRNLGAMIGFGLGLALLSLLPCMLLLALPAGVAGAARLVVALERAEAALPGPGRAS